MREHLQNDAIRFNTKLVKWIEGVEESEMKCLNQSFDRLIDWLHGPFSIIYLCIVCLVTRDIHLELVSNASTKLFNAALKMIRFSDNGTNFVGGEQLPQSHN